MKRNPFIVGQPAPEELDEMYSWHDSYKECPWYLDDVDHLVYGLRGNVIPDQETADRLLVQWINFLEDKGHKDIASEYLLPNQITCITCRTCGKPLDENHDTTICENTEL